MFRNTEVTPEAMVRVGSSWITLGTSAKDLSISHHKTIRRGELVEQINKDPSNYRDLFKDSDCSTLQFKPDGMSDFTALIRSGRKSSPTWHPNPHYITLTMQVEEAVHIKAVHEVENFGSGKLKFKFNGSSTMTRKGQ